MLQVESDLLVLEFDTQRPLVGLFTQAMSQFITAPPWRIRRFYISNRFQHICVHLCPFAVLLSGHSH
jgi:hypothetical protein